MRYETVQARVERAKGENMRQLDRLSSQKDIMSISDDPVGAARSIRLRDRIMNLRQYQKNIEYSKGFIETAEKALSAMSDNLVRAKELAIGMANDTYDASSRDATSREVRELIEELTQLGNTTFSGRYVFAGFRSQTPPLSLDGDYLGDDGAIFLQVSRDNFRQINLPARGLFEAGPDERAQGHFNLLMAAEVLYDGLRDNNKDSIRTAINELDFQLEKVTGFQATLGGISKSLHDTQARLSNEETLDRSTLSKVEDADLYDSSSEFKRTEAVLQGTMLASTKLLQPSLLNFLQ
jgi:flagellar hook-associated protein 3 FlgL